MKVTISARAEENLRHIYKYIEYKFSLSACDKFKKKLIKAASIISDNPEIFPASEINPSVRRCVVSKQTTLYYKIEPDEIQIITIHDTRQNPAKLKL
jgi:plasmid stabilization system protein ParE